MTEIIPEIDANKAVDTGSGAAGRRSRVSTGKALLHGIDGRSREARRYRDVVDALVLEFDISDEFDMALARRYASLCVFTEGEEAKLARGEPADNERLIRASNTQRRLRNALEACHKAHKRAQRKNTL